MEAACPFEDENGVAGDIEKAAAGSRVERVEAARAWRMACRSPYERLRLQRGHIFKEAIMNENCTTLPDDEEKL